MKNLSFGSNCLRAVTFSLGIALLTLAFAPVAQVQAAVTPVSHWRLGENDAGAYGGLPCSSTADLVGGRTLQFLPTVFWDSFGVGATAAARVGSTLCLRAYGAESAGTNAAIPALTNNFGLELWVNPNTLTGNQCLAYNGNSGGSGWGLYLIGDQYRGLFGGVGFVGTATATVGTWAHLALVRDNGITTLYVNGVASGTTSAATPNPPAGRFAVLGQPQNPAAERLFGFLDEVRVFTFAPGAFSTNDLLLAPGWVYSTADSGNGSLRSAITNLNASGAGSIKFLTNGTISLLSSLPAISNSISVFGPGTNLLTISGNGSNRLFQLAANTTNFVSGLTLASGFTSNDNSGAALYNLGDTVLQSCVLVSNTVVGGFGGAAANFGTGTVLATNCTFANNTVLGGDGANGPWDSWSGAGGGGAGMGGAIYTEGTAVTLSGCSLLSNAAAGGNGGNGGAISTFGWSAPGATGGYPNRGLGASYSAGGAGGFGGGGAGGGMNGNGGSSGFAGGGGAGGLRGGVGGSGGAFGGAGGFGDASTFNSGGGGGAGLGGAVFARAGAVSLVNCSFNSNLATNGIGGTGFQSGGNGQGVGGAIFVLNAALNLAGNTFTGNTASTAQPILGGSTVVVNTNDSGAGSLRQAVQIANLSSTASLITFTNTLSGQTILLTSGQIGLSNNLAIDASALASRILLNGNGSNRIFFVNTGVTATLNSLIVTNGLANASLGGGIQNRGSLTLNDCILANNKAGNGGGLVNYNSLTASNCTFSGNIASPGDGAGIYHNNGTTALNRCTLANNSGRYGAGISAAGGALTLNNCTLANNNGSAYGGGLYNQSTTILNHCTLANNTADTGGGIFHNGGAMLITNSIVSLNSGGNISGDAITGSSNLVGVATINLAPLGYYGGPTETMPPMPGSPAIDAGNNTAAAAFPTDQRGKPRLVGGQVDIGAVEGVFDPNYPLVNVTKLGSGNVQFAFTNLSGPSYRVLASTNVAAPLNTWTNLGAPTEAPAGTFTFTDLQATNYSQLFYRVMTP